MLRRFYWFIIALVFASVTQTAIGFFDGTDKQTDALMQGAEESIERIRKGPLSLRFQNRGGLPVNAKVQVELLSHTFDFGANSFGFHKLGDNNPAKAVALDVIDSVFNTVIVCDYWGSNQKKFQGALNWEQPNTGYKIADQLGKRTRFHAVLFGFPRWLHNYKTEEEQWQAIEIRFQQIAEQYGDRIREVDVINEFVNYQYWDQNPNVQYLRKTTYPNMAKPENGARALELARSNFPKAKLVVLEANLWCVSNPVFQEIFEYHKELIRLGAPYDYIGYQAHYYTQGGVPFEKGTKKYGPRTFMMDEINRGIEQMASLGKPMVVTEFNPPSRSNKNKNSNQPSISDEEIAAWETNFYSLIFSKPYMKGLSRWFTIDNLGGRGMDAGVVTETGELKPNYFALQTLIKDKWHTQWEGKAIGGKVTFDGFYGSYRIHAEGFKEVVVDLTVNTPEQRILLIHQ